MPYFSSKFAIVKSKKNPRKVENKNKLQEAFLILQVNLN